MTSRDAASRDVSGGRHAGGGAGTRWAGRRAVSDTPEHSEAPDAAAAAAAALHKRSVTLSGRGDLKPCVHADWVVVVP